MTRILTPRGKCSKNKARGMNSIWQAIEATLNVNKMHISVKVLNGQECTLAVSPSSQVHEVKELISTQMSIPPSSQKLLYRGRALADDNALKDYNIVDGARLTLVVRKSPDVLSPLTGQQPAPPTQLSPSPLTGQQPTPPTQLSPSALTRHQPTPPTQLSPVWEKLYMFLCRHFREQDAALVLAEFRKNFELGLSRLSLDDIDRFAATKIQQQQTAAS